MMFKNTIAVILATVFMLSTSGIILYEHQCNCENETILTLSESHECCEVTLYDEVNLSGKCCSHSKTADMQSCPIDANGSCCNTTEIFLKNEVDVDLPVIKKQIRSFVTLIRVLIPDDTQKNIHTNEIRNFDLPYEKLIRKQFLLTTQLKNAPPLA